MTTMIERMAAAMKKRAAEPLANLNSLEPVLVGSLGDAWPYLVRAAIEAMREPTEAMESAYWRAQGLDRAPCEETWEAMIDAILRETP